MTAIRYKNQDTGSNLDAIIGLLQDPNRGRAIFFASEVTKTTEYSSDEDGPESNLPLIAALVEYTIPGISSVHVVFDGRFLTAVRTPRYLEVRQMLDTALAHGNVFFSKNRIPFTSSLSAKDAVSTLINTKNLEQLDSSTRPHYFSMLTSSGISEKFYIENT